MAEHSIDPGVFIRSMSSRRHLGGLSTAAPGAMDLLFAIGFDVLLVETVGVGQKEVAVMPAGGHRGGGARMKSKANDLRHRCAMSRGVHRSCPHRGTGRLGRQDVVRPLVNKPWSDRVGGHPVDTPAG
jgi:hypothetical protein